MVNSYLSLLPIDLLVQMIFLTAWPKIYALKVDKSALASR